MTEQDRMIEQIISAFDDEMSDTERGQIWAEIFGGNPPSPMQAYARQTRQDMASHEQRAALRRALRRVFPSDGQIQEMFRPAAEKAVQEAANAIERHLK